MNRQSGSQAPIPVTPKDSSPSQQPLLQFSAFPVATPKTKRRSREGRASWLFPARQKVAQAPIWRPSTGNHTPPTPQWPLPRVPLEPACDPKRSSNPFFTTTYTQPRDAPLPPPPSSRCSHRSSSSADSSITTLTDERLQSPDPIKERSAAEPARHPLSPRSPPSPARPPFFPGHQRGGSFQTRYMNMLLSMNKIPRSHNILSNILSWMILVAFVTAPANFCSPPIPAELKGSGISSSLSYDFFNDVPSVSLLAVAFTLFGIGTLGMLYLALCWRRNYIWLMNRIYLPLMLNSLAGFIACLVDLKVKHGFWWSKASYVTVAIEAATLVGSTGGFFVINYLLLGKLKQEHHRETSRKNVVDLVKAGKQPPFAPGSVV